VTSKLLSEALAIAKEGKRLRITARRKSQVGRKFRRSDEKSIVASVEHTLNVCKRGNQPCRHSHKLGSVDNTIAYTSYESFNRSYEMGNFDVEHYRGTGVKPKSSGRKSKPIGYVSSVERGSLVNHMVDLCERKIWTKDELENLTKSETRGGNS